MSMASFKLLRADEESGNLARCLTRPAWLAVSEKRQEESNWFGPRKAPRLPNYVRTNSAISTLHPIILVSS